MGPRTAVGAAAAAAGAAAAGTGPAGTPRPHSRGVVPRVASYSQQISSMVTFGATNRYQCPTPPSAISPSGQLYAAFAGAPAGGAGGSSSTGGAATAGRAMMGALGGGLYRTQSLPLAQNQQVHKSSGSSATFSALPSLRG